jgi:predicted DNA-binding transcriptional regulator AlpA
MGDQSVRASDLVGPHEIEVLLEMSTGDVSELLAGTEFPPPIIERGAERELRLWHRDDVLAWRAGRADSASTGLLGDVLAASREVVASDAEDLMTATEVAELLGWSSPSTPWDLSKKGSFPAPVRRHGRTKLWDRREVEHWGRTAQRRRRRGAHQES